MRILYYISLAFFLVLTLAGFKGKDAVYYHQNIEEARKLMDGRCSIYKNISSDNVFVKDPECLVVSEALKKRKIIEQRGELINHLQNMETNLLKISKIESDEDKLRYREFRKVFEEDLGKTEEFITSCIKDDQRTKINSIECLSAVDLILTELEHRQEKELFELHKNVSYRDYYRQYFRESSGKIEELLEGRCENILSDPWYYYDLDSQDKECNAALAESKRRKRLSRALLLEGIKTEKKDLSYYRSNLLEAEKMVEKCSQDTVGDSQVCEYAKEALREERDRNLKRAKYEEEYKKDILGSRKIISECRSGKEKDPLKCEVAFYVVSQNVLTKKESEEFKRYTKKHLLDTENAEKLLHGRCAIYNETDDDVGFVKDIECMAVKDLLKKKKASEGRVLLIKNLSDFKEKIKALNRQEKVDDEVRYKEFSRKFYDTPEETQKFLASCFEQEERLEQNAIECMAASDVTIEKLQETQEKYVAQLKHDDERDKKYVKFFRENEGEIEKLLEGRCEILFADPWYEYDPDVQDKECNAARDEKRRQKIKARIAKLQMEQNKLKDLEYYRRNIPEAEKVNEECKENKDHYGCDYATQVLLEERERKKELDGYRRFYEDNLLEARKTLDNCHVDNEANEGKCNIAFEVINRDIKDKKKEKGFQKRVKYYRDNKEEARQLAESKCKLSEVADNQYVEVFEENIECPAVRYVMQEELAIKAGDELLEELTILKNKLSISIIMKNTDEKLAHRKFRVHFEENLDDAEEFIVSCLSDSERMINNGVECIAAIDAVLITLKRDKEEREFAAGITKKHIDKEDDEGKEVVIENRCKVLFSDPWYEYDPYVKDEECDEALAEVRRKARNKKMMKEKKLQSNIKDMQYYKENVEEAEFLKDECIEGRVENLRYCEFALQVMEEKERLIIERKEHNEFYSSHLLAAKYKLRWCKSVMVDFNPECQIVSQLLKDHEDKVLNEDKYKSYYDFFVLSPLEAKVVSLGECKELLADSWYFLDINLQTEKCNAASDVAN